MVCSALILGDCRRAVGVALAGRLERLANLVALASSNCLNADSNSATRDHRLGLSVDCRWISFSSWLSVVRFIRVRRFRRSTRRVAPSLEGCCCGIRSRTEAGRFRDRNAACKMNVFRSADFLLLQVPNTALPER